MFYTAKITNASKASLLKQVSGPQSDWLLNKNEGDTSLDWNLCINPDGSYRVWFEVWDGEASSSFDTVGEAIDYFMTLPGELD